MKFIFPVSRLCCFGTGRSWCLWFLTGLSHPPHTESSRTWCVTVHSAAATRSPPDQKHKGFNWSFNLARGDIHYEADWFPPLVEVVWKCLCEGAVGKDRTCSPSSCAEPAGLQQLETGLSSWGKRCNEAQGIPAHPCSRGAKVLHSLCSWAWEAVGSLTASLNLWEEKAWLVWAGWTGHWCSLSPSKGWPAAVAFTS